MTTIIPVEDFKKMVGSSSFRKEDDLQKQCVKWFNYNFATYRNRLLKFGADTNIGVKAAIRLQAMGYKKGTPDLLLAIPRNGKGGLFIELKTESGKLSPAQKLMKQELEQDYHVMVCYNFDQFKWTVQTYLAQGVKQKIDIALK